MSFVLTCVCHPDHTDNLQQFAQTLQTDVPCDQVSWFNSGIACDFFYDTMPDESAHQLIGKHARHYMLDWCLQETVHRKKRFLISDMDSTIIQQECIDELADMQSLKAKVSAITERAMAGELDFAASLKERVALLIDLPITALDDVWESRIQTSPGAKTLIATLRAHGCFCALVSGGFTYFTQKITDLLGFDAHHANELAINGRKLAGFTHPPVVDAAAKRLFLEQTCRLRRIDIRETLAVGDGANDLLMIEAAGLGVAYRAKPVVQAQADAAINYTDLTSLLYFQGYGADQFVPSIRAEH